MEQALSQDPGRTWPELQGKKYNEAAKAIKNEFPHLKVEKVQEDSFVTMDFNPDRVRVFVNEEDVVVRVPGTG